MKLRRQGQRGEAEIQELVGVIAAIFVIYLFVITWPASLALVIALLVWFFTRDNKSPIGGSLHDAALPVLIGISAFWIASLVRGFAPEVSDNAREWLFAAEQGLLRARLVVHALSGPDLTVYLLLLGILLILLFFVPESRAIGQLIRTKKQLARLHLCLLAMTSFTFFGGQAVDGLAQKDHDNRLSDFEISLRTEIEPANKLLARELAKDSVGEVLKSPIAEPNRARLRYLIESFRNPVYIEVPKPSKQTKNMSEKFGIDPVLEHWSFDDSSAAPPERMSIEGSQVMYTFIRDFLKEVQTDTEPSQSAASAEEDIQTIARQSLGPVPESPEEWQRREKVIEEEKVRASQSEQFFKEASADLTEGLTATFSEAVGAFIPNIQELAKEWIVELNDAAITPLFERKTVHETESLLGWFRKSITASHVQVVPEELREETRPATSALSRILFPSFLSRELRPAVSGHEDVPEEIATEIRRREENARKEIEEIKKELERNGSQVRSRRDPFDELKERKPPIGYEGSWERQRLREREFREPLRPREFREPLRVP